MNKNPFSIAAILSSLLYMAIAMKINHDMAIQYAKSDRKTKALYGFIELRYLYQYYFVVLIIISIIFMLIAFRRKENKLAICISLGFILFTVLLILIKPWTYMIYLR